MIAKEKSAKPINPESSRRLLFSTLFAGLLIGSSLNLHAQETTTLSGYDVDRFPYIDQNLPTWADQEIGWAPVFAFSNLTTVPAGNNQGLQVILTMSKATQLVKTVIIKDAYFKTPEGLDMCSSVEDFFASGTSVVEVTVFWHMLYIALNSGWKAYFEKQPDGTYFLHYFYNGRDPVTTLP